MTSGVDSRGVDRLVVDSTTVSELSFDDEGDRTTEFVSSLRRCNATSMLVSEMTDSTSDADERCLTRGVIFLRNYLDETGMTRGVQAVKMRGTSIDCDIRAVDFTDEGLWCIRDGS